MSWKRILETARRNGIPLIVSDPEGRDPMVVVTLEQFEAMYGSPKMQEIGSSDVFSEQDEPSFSPIPAPHSHTSEMRHDVSHDFGDETPLEEQFFLEPLDDQKSA